ncbi:MAG: FAD-dependent thymidylate synthase [Paludibacter sp.]|nr:FAD-dependent thymidylate synthase [Paludibacter sp.]
MRVVNSSYEILSEIDSEKMMKNIEIAGRTCYKSENKITMDSATKFVEMITKRGHLSVIEHEKITVRFVFDRGISHEMVRHRLASFSQESTRYCNYSKDKHDNQITVIGLSQYLKNESSLKVWMDAMEDAENAYFKLIELGETPQIARSVLPNSLKTEIVVTANLREWRLILTQRTANAAHPQIREVMRPLLAHLKETLPAIFNDISYE